MEKLVGEAELWPWAATREMTFDKFERSYSHCAAAATIDLAPRDSQYQSHAASYAMLVARVILEKRIKILEEAQ